MVSWKIFTISTTLGIWFLNCQAETKLPFIMGCECGKREVDENAEADCEESARLEAPDQAEK